MRLRRVRVAGLELGPAQAAVSGRVHRLDAHREPQRVYVGEGLQDGERLVVSDLATPVEGMKLREARAPASSPGEATQPAADPETRP